ncbi:SDR family oxidoreductase [Sinorhizobium sp. 8-89]|uniref:SDR family NAD(P)-dependent oxidoreductase n=1 Tax=Sinorhizobium sp. 7-81 TaxID=3049087 RepID=UPI0024C21448|nr:SDR family oxidoreductase [Sinorhizobium sp. 7-81]MDK1389261.1 SDR family oxidoreductase [Sinorhizobium sp. 7-81]
MNRTEEHTHGDARGCVIVTGAASGIGRATTSALISERWQVLALDCNAEALEVLRRDVDPCDALTIHAVDVTRTTEVGRIFSELPDATPLRGLVCCAARGDNTRFLDISLDSLHSLIELNFIATFSICQTAARCMVKEGGGSIVNISSVSGLRANAGRSAYGSSKAAVEMLSKVMAVELAPFNVRVNALAPGPTLTEMAAKMHDGAERRRLLSSVPQARYASPDEIAQGVAFLLDPIRSGYITGHTLCVDGGMFAAGSFEPVVDAS